LQFQHGTGRRGAEFLFDEARVRPGVAQRTRCIACAHERLHQSESRAFTERIELGNPLPPADGGFRGPALVGRLCQPYCGFARSSIVPASLRLLPTLELGRPGQVEAVENGPE
jgi:hypothetical protein